MTSTKRGKKDKADGDFYPTPAWCVSRLLERVPFPAGLWFEPCAGKGAIIEAVNAQRSDVRWCAAELFAKHADALCRLKARTKIGDVTRMDLSWVKDPAVVITNPPFSLWQEIAEHVLPIAPLTVMLLRLDVLGAAKRASWLRAHMPDVYVIPDRPSFTADGGTDSNYYGWFVWHAGARRRSGKIVLLACTPQDQRAGDRSRYSGANARHAARRSPARAIL